jgi:hypothetical protein
MITSKAAAKFKVGDKVVTLCEIRKQFKEGTQLTITKVFAPKWNQHTRTMLQAEYQVMGDWEGLVCEDDIDLV